MSFSSGTRSMLSEVASWAAVAVMCVGTIIYFDELKGIMRIALDIPDPAASEASASDPSASQTAAAAGDAEPAGDAPKQHSGYTIELEADEAGHYVTDVEINGTDTKVLVDTGATLVAMTYEDAERAGIYITDKDFTHKAQTANGASRVAPITIDKISIGDITVRNVRGMVAEPGALHVTLLGMTFLSQLDRVDMSSGTLVLQD